MFRFVHLCAVFVIEWIDSDYTRACKAVDQETLAEFVCTMILIGVSTYAFVRERVWRSKHRGVRR